MNNQGKVGQFKNTAGQNEVNSGQSVGQMGLYGFSSTYNRRASFLHGEIDLNREFEGNNSSHPDETETQNASGSSGPIVVLQSGIADYVVEEQGEHKSMDVKRLSCKRRSPENELRELSIGESSRMSTDQRARIPKRRVTVNQGSTSHSPITSAVPYTAPEISQPLQFETGTGQGIRGPASGIAAYPSPFGPFPGNPLSNAPGYVHASGFYHIYSANLSNAPGWFPGFNFAQEYVQGPPIANHPMATFTGSRRQSSHIPLPSTPSLGMESPHRIVNRTSLNQQMPMVGNVEPPFPLWSVDSDQSINTLLSEARHALAVRYNSISSILQELLALQEEIGESSTGLSEEDIVMHLKQEKFVCTTEETSTNESCCICQEDYAEGEDISKLDCDHKFHFTCIKEWLVRKNTCPLCKCTALAVPSDEDL